MEVMKFLVYLFLLNVGTAPADKQQFALLRGTWEVVAVGTDLKNPLPSQWRGRTIIFARAVNAPAQPPKSLAYWGRLNTRRKPPAIESREITFQDETPRLEDEPRDPLVPAYPSVTTPFRYAAGFFTLYQVHGDQLTLLITPTVGKSDILPTAIPTTGEPKGWLLHLRLRRTP